MKYHPLLPFVAACSLLTSCFKEEPLNAECDIEAVYFHLDEPLGTFYQLGDTLQKVLSDNTDVVFNVRREPAADLSLVEPQLVLTPGASVKSSARTVDEATGTVRWNYVVGSQDKQWSRAYTVSVVPTSRTVRDTVAYDFENFELEPQKKKYYVWHDELNDGQWGNNWATGNAGYQMSMGKAPADEYPSVPLAYGYDGYGVKLTTLSTGPFGAVSNMRIAAGNFFLGKFDVANALTDAMKATCMGIPFDRKPLKLQGYYKYTPGKVFQDRNGKPVENRTDAADIYAVFYRNEETVTTSDGKTETRPVMLHGEDTKTNPNIVAIAQVAYVKPTTEWTLFDVTFDYMSEINLETLVSRGYNLALVFSSSIDGHHFQGAIGSQLCIDKVRVVCEKEE